MAVTGDETEGQAPNGDLREIQAKLDAAVAEVAALRVLLTLRTHQHDQAWQAARRSAAECDALRNTAIARAGEGEADLMRERAAEQAGAALAEAVARADARTEAVRTVLGAVLASLRPWGLDRRRFKRGIVQASGDVPNEGVEAERHAVLLAEARRVLGRAE